MVDVKISEYPDGKDIQTSNAEAEIIDGGVNYRTSVRPNPEQQINVRNQAQLEAALGVNLEIPDGTNVTIVVDDSFDLTTSIKLGAGSGLQLNFSNVGPVISWMGTGAMIENTVGDEAAFLIMQNVNISGDTSNSIFDLTISAFGFVALRSLNMDNLTSIGSIASPNLFLASFTGFNILRGLVADNCGVITIDNVIVGNFFPTNTTWFTFLNGTTQVIAKINDVTASNPLASDTLFFLDPNSVVNSSFVITASAITVAGAPGFFYQLGTDIGILLVTDPVGETRFTTGSDHGLSIGQAVVLSGFVTETTYNGTFIVTAIPTTTEFEVAEIVFTATDTGNMNETSLDQTDILVRARDNASSPDSKNIGSLVVNGNAVLTAIITQNVFEDLNLGGLAVAGSNIERWIVTNTTTGEMMYIGIEDFNGVLNAVVVLQPNTTDVYDIRMLVNGAVTPDGVSSRSGTSQSGVTPVASIPFNSPLSVVTGDLVRLQVANEDGIGDPTITDLSIGAQNP